LPAKLVTGYSALYVYRISRFMPDTRKLFSVVPPRVVVIGGGASGTAVAVHLLRQAISPLRLTLIEPQSRLGLGVAYSTVFRSHVLNVRAADMSIFPDRPAHFLHWLHDNGFPSAGPWFFAPRLTYGAYLEDVLASAVRQARRSVTFEHVRGGATRLSNGGDGLVVETDRGDVLKASCAVLALGNVPSNNPLPTETPEPFCAWSPEAVRRLSPDSTVLLVGSGLTAVDTCLSLRELGHRGQIFIVSRHGLMPRVHVRGAKRTHWRAQDLSIESLRGIFSKVRIAARRDLESGGTWHGPIDGLRPHSHEIWQQLSLKERRRFVRHLRPYWDVHRHRVAPAVGAAIEEMRSRGQLVVTAGRIVSSQQGKSGVSQVTIAQRGGGELVVVADRVINCTGPEADARRFPIPLLRQLVADGLVRHDPLFLGVDAASDGNLIGKDGAEQDRLYAIGPLLKGVLWESIAIPEIRQQAAALAQKLLATVAEDTYGTTDRHAVGAGI
jgi:uncharacterized NAD(P)/FAD-binding protein YdhS